MGAGQLLVLISRSTPAPAWAAARQPAALQLPNPRTTMGLRRAEVTSRFSYGLALTPCATPAFQYRPSGVEGRGETAAAAVGRLLNVLALRVPKHSVHCLLAIRRCWQSAADNDIPTCGPAAGGHAPAHPSPALLHWCAPGGSDASGSSSFRMRW